MTMPWKRGKIREVERVLLFFIIAMTLSGCATESDPDRPSWEDAKKQVEAAFEKDSAGMDQALRPAQGPTEDPDQASQNP